MQERDLLLREKSALQAILASSAEEIRRLFEAEQKHVVEMKTVWKLHTTRTYCGGCNHAFHGDLMHICAHIHIHTHQLTITASQECALGQHRTRVHK